MLSITGLAPDTSWVYHHASDTSSSQSSINACLVNEWPFKSHLKEGDREKEVIIAYKAVPLSGEQHCFRTCCVKALIQCCDRLISFSGWRYSAKLDFCLDFPKDFLPWQEFNKQEPGLHMILLVLSYRHSAACVWFSRLLEMTHITDFIVVFPDAQCSLRSLQQEREPVVSEAMAKHELVLEYGMEWWWGFTLIRRGDSVLHWDRPLSLYLAEEPRGLRGWWWYCLMGWLGSKPNNACKMLSMVPGVRQLSNIS